MSNHSFSTSTPRQRLNSQPSEKSTILEDITSFAASENSFNTQPNTNTAQNSAFIPMSLPSTFSLPSTPIAMHRRRSRRSHRILFKQEQPTPTSSDSNAENQNCHPHKLKVKKTFRNSIGFNKRRSSLLITKQSIRTKSKRREQRIDAFSRYRKLADDTAEQSVSLTNNATFLIDLQKDSEIDHTTDEEAAEIVAFHSELVQYKQNSKQSQSEQFDHELSVVDELNQLHLSKNFEHLCNLKQNQHPYGLENDEKSSPKATNSSEAPAILVPPIITESVASSNFLNETPHLSSLATSSIKPSFNTTSHSAISSFNTTGTTAKSSHCTRTYSNQHKIPQLFQIKSRAINADAADSNCLQSISPLRENITFLWNNMHFMIKMYIIAITFGFVAILISSILR